MADRNTHTLTQPVLATEKTPKLNALFPTAISNLFDAKFKRHFIQSKELHLFQALSALLMILLLFMVCNIVYWPDQAATWSCEWMEFTFAFENVSKIDMSLLCVRLLIVFAI